MKASLANSFKPSGSTTDSNEVQYANTDSPIEVTEFGISIFTKPVPQKAPEPMAVTVSGIMVAVQPATSSLVEVLMMALQLLRESNTGLPSSTVIALQLSKYRKA